MRTCNKRDGNEIQFSRKSLTDGRVSGDSVAYREDSIKMRKKYVCEIADWIRPSCSEVFKTGFVIGINMMKTFSFS